MNASLAFVPPLTPTKRCSTAIASASIRPLSAAAVSSLNGFCCSSLISCSSWTNDILSSLVGVAITKVADRAGRAIAALVPPASALDRAEA